MRFLPAGFRRAEMAYGRHGFAGGHTLATARLTRVQGENGAVHRLFLLTKGSQERHATMMVARNRRMSDLGKTPMSEKTTFSFQLEQQEDYAFLVRFDGGLPALLTDEPPPLGQGKGPNPSRLLLAAVANCLMASLLFALRKFKNETGKLAAEVSGELVRNEKGRLRVGKATVAIRLGVAAEALQHLDRALAQFEDFCVVTQSVRSGFPVEVAVFDREGVRLK